MGSLVSIDSVLEEYLQGLPIERGLQMRCVLDGAVACCVVVVDCWRILCMRVGVFVYADKHICRAKSPDMNAVQAE